MNSRPIRSHHYTWLALCFRLVVFGVVQGVITLLLFLIGIPDPWRESARWWVFAAIITNFATILLLVRLYTAQGKRYWDILRVQRSSLWSDLAVSFGVFLLAAPIGIIPGSVLGETLFGAPDIPLMMLFRPLPTWAILVGILFPATIALSELPIYFGYAMPRLEKNFGSGWFALVLTALFLSLQHLTLPIIMDWRFITWRALMFLPFALYLGLVLKYRPRLLPYLMASHFIIDLLALSTYLAR